MQSHVHAVDLADQQAGVAVGVFVTASASAKHQGVTETVITSGASIGYMMTTP